MSITRSSRDLVHYDRATKKARLELHKGQTEAYDSQRRFVFVVAGTQSGKTSF